MQLGQRLLMRRCLAAGVCMAGCLVPASAGSSADDATEVHTLAYVIRTPARGDQFVYGMDDSLPPQAAGWPVTGWDWDAHVLSHAFGGVRWTDAPVELTGTWDGSTFHLTHFGAGIVGFPESSDPTIGSGEKTPCSAEAAATFSAVGEQLPPGSRQRDLSLVVEIRPPVAGRHCRTEIRVLSRNNVLDQALENVDVSHVEITYLIRPLAEPLPALG